MLKLERINKADELLVSIRKQPIFFNGLFLQALGYALLFHLLALILFQIAPFKVIYQESLLPPVTVLTEIPKEMIYVDSLYDGEGSVPPYLIAPKRNPQPEMNQNEKIVMVGEPHFQKVDARRHFLALEHSYELDRLFDPIEVKEPELFSIHFSGAIAELPHDQNKIVPFPRSVQQIRLNVQVNVRSGEIFWWKILEGKSSPEQDLYISELMKELKFTPQSQFDILSGEIEIVTAEHHFTKIGGYRLSVK